MNIGRLLVALFLVIIGTVWILQNYNIIPDFDFSKLWPLVFVFLGISILFEKNTTNKKEDE